MTNFVPQINIQIDSWYRGNYKTKVLVELYGKFGDMSKLSSIMILLY